MNDTENAWNRLARLIQEEPPREGRTGSVRNEKRRDWISRIRDWLDRGLKAEKDGQGVKVALYGETLPGTDVSFFVTAPEKRRFSHLKPPRCSYALLHRLPVVRQLNY